MSLKAKIANKPKMDKKGYVSAKIQNIEKIEKEDSQFNLEQFEFTFEVEGSTKPIKMKSWTSTKISGQKWENGSGLDYTKLSILVMQLGLISKAELIKLDDEGKDPNLDLGKLIGKKVKFKLIKNLKKSRLSSPDLKTIEFVS